MSWSIKSNVLCMNLQDSMGRIFALAQGFSTSELLTFGAGKFSVAGRRAVLCTAGHLASPLASTH